MSIARPEAAVLYGRVSSLPQEKEDTIASQMAALRDYAAAHSIAVVDEYVDNGYSGDTLVRPELDRLRDDAKTGRFRLVLMTEPTRLARRYVYKELVEDDLRAAGVSILYINRPLGDTPEDRLLGGMQGLLAEYERAKILDRTRRGMRYKVSQGHIWRSRRNYGYRYVPPAKVCVHGLPQYCMSPTHAAPHGTLNRPPDDDLSATGGNHERSAAHHAAHPRPRGV